MTRPTILLTGGCGYIGNHTLVLLLEKGYNAVIVDNLVNSSAISLDRVAKIADLSEDERKERIVFHQIDICDEVAFRKVFETSPTFQACIHFAGLKVRSIDWFLFVFIPSMVFPISPTFLCNVFQAVGESKSIPLKYYENNLMGTFVLLRLMDEFNCHSLVFSSSATVYGEQESPITETAQVGTGITNAYGRTKYMIEEILRDFHSSKELTEEAKKSNDWSIVILRCVEFRKH